MDEKIAGLYLGGIQHDAQMECEFRETFPIQFML